MGKEERILGIVRDIYAAAEAPERWPAVLDRIADTLRSSMTVLFSQDLERPGASVAATTRIDATDVQRYAQYYSSHNVYFEHGQHLIAPGAVIDDSMYDRQRVRSSEYYADYLTPLRADHTIAVVLAHEGGTAAMFSTFRSAAEGPYRRDELELVQLIRPHLEQAFRIHGRLYGPTTRADFSLAALDLIPTGVLLVDRHARVTHMNASAQAMVRANDGLTIEQRMLHLATAAANRRLAGLLAEARAHRLSGHSAAGVVLADRPSGKAPYSIVIAPLAEAADDVVALLITDPIVPSTNETTLRSLYGLTPAESRVAAALASGKTLPEIAALFQVKIATIRTHLQRIFTKTGTRRQSELIRLIASAGRAYEPDER